MKAKFMRLGDCAEVLPGLSIKSKLEHDPQGTHWLVLPRHVRPGGNLVYFPDEVRVDEDIKVKPGTSASKYLVRQDDVLFIARGTNNLPIYVESVPEDTVAGNMFLIVRPKPNILGKYLAWLLCQRSLQAALIQSRTISVTPMIQRSEFVQMVVPVPSVEVQNQIAHLYDLMLRERTLADELTAIINKLHEDISEKFIQKMQEE